MRGLLLKRNVAGPALLAAFAVACGLACGAMQHSLAVGAAGQTPRMVPSELIEGSIAEIMGTSTAPFGLAISGADGSNTWLAVDPLETVVLQGGRVTQFSNLERGQRVKARFAMKQGKEVARSIEITDPLPMPAPSDKPVSPALEKPLTTF